MIAECTCYIEGFEQWELLKDYFANTKRKFMPEHIWKISEMALKKHGTSGSVKNAVRSFINER